MNIQVTVKAKAKNAKLVEVEENTFVAYVKSPPIEDKANTELTRLVANHFDVPASRVQIVRGEKSHIKLLEIQNDF